MTHIKKGVEDELDIVVDHGPDGDRHEIRIIQNSGCVVGNRLGWWGVRVVDDLNCIVEDKVIRDDIIPDGQSGSKRAIEDLHVFTLSNR